MPTFHRLLAGKNGDGPPPTPALMMSKFGPYIEIAIAPPEKDVVGRQFQIVNGLALIDTGAAETVVSLEAMKQLGLKEVGSMLVVGPGAPSAVLHQYACDIHFAAGNVPRLSLAAVGASPLDGSPFIALLGRDFLADKLLILDGRAGYYTLAW